MASIKINERLPRALPSLARSLRGGPLSGANYVEAATPVGEHQSRPRVSVNKSVQ